MLKDKNEEELEEESIDDIDDDCLFLIPNEFLKNKKNIYKEDLEKRKKKYIHDNIYKLFFDRIIEIKNMISDLSSNPKYYGCIFKLGDDVYFTINNYNIYYNRFSDNDYFCGFATSEQIKETDSIINCSDFEKVFINIIYCIAANHRHKALIEELEDMIKYCANDQVEYDSLLVQSKLLIKKLKAPDSLFKDNIDVFIDALSRLKEGIMYIYPEDDQVVCSMMYYSICKDVDFSIADDFYVFCWMDILKNIDNYIWKKNQIE